MTNAGPRSDGSNVCIKGLDIPQRRFKSIKMRFANYIVAILPIFAAVNAQNNASRDTFATRNGVCTAPMTVAKDATRTVTVTLKDPITVTRTLKDPVTVTRSTSAVQTVTVTKTVTASMSAGVQTVTITASCQASVSTVDIVSTVNIATTVTTTTTATVPAAVPDLYYFQANFRPAGQAGQGEQGEQAGQAGCCSLVGRKAVCRRDSVDSVQKNVS